MVTERFMSRVWEIFHSFIDDEDFDPERTPEVLRRDWLKTIVNLKILLFRTIIKHVAGGWVKEKTSQPNNSLWEPRRAKRKVTPSDFR